MLISHGMLELDESWPRTRTEDVVDASAQRPHVSVAADDQWGRSESLDPDNVGDIADEGAGHRG